MYEGNFAVVIQKNNRATLTGGPFKINNTLVFFSCLLKFLEGEVSGPLNLLA